MLYSVVLHLRHNGKEIRDWANDFRWELPMSFSGQKIQYTKRPNCWLWYTHYLYIRRPICWWEHTDLLRSHGQYPHYQRL